MANDRHSYVEIYPTNWISGTAHLTMGQEWVYLQVCLYNWDKAKPMPSAIIPGCMNRHKGWKADLKALTEIGKIIVNHDGSIFCKRALEVAHKAYSLWERKSRGGRNLQQAIKEAKVEEVSSDTLQGDLVGVLQGDLVGVHTGNRNGNQTFPNGKDPHSPPSDLLFSPPEPEWSDYIDHREKMKRPMSDHAKKLAIRKLIDLEADGHDLRTALNNSIMNSWTGIHPPSQDRKSYQDRPSGWAWKDQS